MSDTTSFPPLRDLAPGHHEARRQHLLSEIARQRTWPRLRWPTVRVFRGGRSRRSALALAALAATLMGAASVGIAAGMGAFDGIGAVQHSQSAGDVLDPATAAYVQLHIHGELDTARHVGQLPDGQNVYVITSSQNDLCAVVEPPNPSAWCGTPLSKAHPATLYAYPMGSDSPPTAWVDFGVALDGVTSVTFQPSEADRATPGGPAVTVPVNGNLWLYQGQRMTDILQPLTAHFADGTTVVEPATGNNCAAC